MAWEMFEVVLLPLVVIENTMAVSSLVDLDHTLVVTSGVGYT